MLKENNSRSRAPLSPAVGASKLTKAGFASNWEKRLSAARAKREQALARNGVQKPKVTDAVEQVTEYVAQTGELLDADQAIPPDVQGEVAPVVVATAPLQRAAEETAGVSRARFGRTLLIAMACCSSLGFGLALGFGTLLGLGRMQTVAPAGPEPTAIAGDTVPAQMNAGLPPVATALPTDTDAPSEQEATTDAGAQALSDAVPLPDSFAPSVEIYADLQLTAPEAGEASLVAWLPLQPVIPSELGVATAVPAATPDFTPGAERTLAEELGAAGTDLSVLDLRVYAPDAMPSDTLEADLARLQGTGLPIENLQRVTFAVSAPHIRFYNAEDTAIATALAADLQIEARDFTGQQSGPVGLVEVWLQGTSKGRSADQDANGRNGDYLLDRLRNRLFGN